MLQPAPRRPRPRGLAAAFLPLAALAGVLSACSSTGESAPDDAQLWEFCTTWDAQHDPEVDGAEDRAAWAEEMAEVGTPEGIDEEAREGFELVVDRTIEAVGDVEVAPGDWKEEMRLDAAFEDYRREACAEY